MTLPALLRVLFLAGLAGLGMHLTRSNPAQARGVLELTSADASVLSDAILGQLPPARLHWTASTPPDAQALWLLSPSALTPPLTVPVGPRPRLAVTPPIRPIAGRNAAIGIGMTGPPGDSTALFVTDALGAVDSVQLRFGSGGRADVGARVQPSGSGWQSWSIRAGADSANIGAWTTEAQPLRVLALGGTPDWESRFALRALEEAGISVDGRFDLGRRSVGGGIPSDFGAFDVVLLMGEVPLGANAAERLRAFVTRGGGVLVAPTVATAPPTTGSTVGALLRGWGIVDSLQIGVLESGASPQWSLPPELSPLAASPARVRTLTGSAPGLGPSAGATTSHVGARDNNGRVLSGLAAIGRGRVAFTGIAESWRWRMEAGDIEGHRIWWRDWVEWTAGGLSASVVLSAPRTPVPVGSRVDVSVILADANAGAPLPTTVDLWRPDGRMESLPVAAAATDPTGELPLQGVARFLAATPGAYTVRAPGAETGVAAVEVGTSASPADRSLAAIASGRPGDPGVPIPEDGVRSLGLDGENEIPWTPAGGPTFPLWLGGLGALLLAVEWTLRRRRGGP